MTYKLLSLSDMKEHNEKVIARVNAKKDPSRYNIYFVQAHQAEEQIKYWIDKGELKEKLERTIFQGRGLKTNHLYKNE